MDDPLTVTSMAEARARRRPQPPGIDWANVAIVATLFVGSWVLTAALGYAAWTLIRG
jgi:hypothetical protein